MGEPPCETYAGRGRDELARIWRHCVVRRAGRVLIEQCADQIPQIAADKVAE